MTLKIRGKVMGSIGIVVALLAVFSTVAVVRLSSIEKEIDSMLLATSVEQDALRTMKLERDYLLTGDEQHAEATLQAVDRMFANMDSIKAVSSDERLVGGMEKARGSITRYRELFWKTVETMHKNADEATRLEEAGVAVTDQLTSFLKAKREQADGKSIKQIDLAGDVLDLMYAIRVREKTYLRSHRDEDYRGMRESLAQLTRKFDELDKLSSDSGDRDKLRAARESALRYKQVAADLAADRQKLDEQLLPTMAKLGDTALALCREAASRAQAGMFGTERATNTILIIGMIICLLVGGAIAWYMGGKLSAPLAHLTSVAKGLAAGDLDQEITIKSRDELGELADSFRETFEYIKNAAAVAERVAQNDLTVKIEPRSEKDVLNIAFQKMIANLTDVVRQLTENARELASASTEIASASEQMSRGVHEQNQQVSQVSAAIEQMTATIVESSKNAGEASDTSRQSVDTAGAGGQVVSDTINGMQAIGRVVRESAESIAKLAHSADRIGEIIAVIDDIADQTNLLALNAAIEAARAGEQGRGFAVVADEVRKLAERTGKATGEITDMIKGIQRQTEEAVNSMESGIQEVDKGRDLADRAGASLNEIVTMSQRVMDMIQQIATASEEQSVAAEQIARNVEQIANVTRETASGAEQSATAAEQLSRQAEGLQLLISQFRITGAGLGILKLAKDDHRRYMALLSDIISGEREVSNWKSTNHHQCRFGKWYYSPAAQAYSGIAAFGDIERHHVNVHKFANDAIAAYKEGAFDKANRLLQQANEASHGVIETIEKLEKQIVAA